MTELTTRADRAGSREWWGLAVLALPVLLLSIDMNVLYLALPAVSQDLAPSGTELLWITDVYGFMIAGFLVTMGTLGDRIGRRRLLLVGAAAFGLASVATAFAPSAGALIAARALLGVAGATLMPSTLALITTMFRDARQRSTAIGVWMTCFMLGTVLGPVVGGVLLQFFWWGSVFLLGVPVMLILLVTGPLLLPEHRNATAGRIDLASVALALGALLPLVYAVKSAATAGDVILTGAGVLVAAVCGTLFVRRQRTLADPMIDLTLFAARGFRAALGVMLVGGIVIGGIYLFFTQYLQIVAGQSALTAGLWLLPPALALAVGSMVAPALAPALGAGRVLAGGMLVSVVGLGILALVDGTPAVATAVVGMSLVYFGFGPGAVLGTDLIVGSAPAEKAGSASSLSETSTELGVALGVALLGSLGTAVYRSTMSAEPAVAGDPVATSLTGVSESGPAVPAAVLDVARTAFADAFGVVALTGAVVVAIAAAVAFALLGDAPADATDGGPDAATADAGDPQVARTGG